MAPDLNGRPWNLEDFESRQSQKFESLEEILKRGFESLTNELKLSREQGHIPVPIVQHLITLFKPVITTLCTTIIVLIVWFTGLKTFLPQIIGQ